MHATPAYASTSICIRHLTLREIRMPLVEPFRSAGGTVDVRRVLLLELTEADGTTAWSECVAEATPSYMPDTVDTCWLAIAEWLAPRVLGHSLGYAGGIDAVLSVGIRGHRMARAALEMGVWGLASARQRVPLAELLNDGSAVARVGAVRPSSHVATGVALGMQDSPELLVKRARKALAAGYQRVKLKVGPGRDVAFVAAVRAALGDAAPLSADANCSYSLDHPEHVAALEELDTLGLAMIEQPLAPDDLVRHAELQRRLRTPLCLDESITSTASVADMITLGSGRVVNVKPGRVGGFAQSVAIHDACARAGLPVWCGGMHETGIGRAYNVALASLPNFTEPGDLSPSARYWARDVVSPEWTMDAGGRVRVPLDRPGIGVDVDTAYIDALTVRSITLPAR